MKASDNTCSATLTPGDRHRDLAYPVFLTTYQRFQTSNPSNDSTVAAARETSLQTDNIFGVSVGLARFRSRRRRTNSAAS